VPRSPHEVLLCHLQQSLDCHPRSVESAEIRVQCQVLTKPNTVTIGIIINHCEILCIATEIRVEEACILQAFGCLPT
jgi:hypothetical protein